MKGIHFGMPRQLKKQDAWYYLPFGGDKTVHVFKVAGSESFNVRISAKKLLRELKEWERLNDKVKG